MKKTYKLQVLDCANCAAKMERKIAKLDGVNSVSISFMTQKMTIDADDGKFEEIINTSVGIITKTEPDCKVILK